jgi:hypothetical protein
MSRILFLIMAVQAAASLGCSKSSPASAVDPPLATPAEQQSTEPAQVPAPTAPTSPPGTTNARGPVPMLPINLSEIVTVLGIPTERHDDRLSPTVRYTDAFTVSQSDYVGLEFHVLDAPNGRKYLERLLDSVYFQPVEAAEVRKLLNARGGEHTARRFVAKVLDSSIFHGLVVHLHPNRKPMAGAETAVKDFAAELAARGNDVDVPVNLAIMNYIVTDESVAADSFSKAGPEERKRLEERSAARQRAMTQTIFRTEHRGLARTRDTVATPDVVVEVPLSIRVRGAMPFFNDRHAYSGLLTAVCPTEIREQRWAVPASQGGLRPCRADEAAAAIRAGGVLYAEEFYTTRLKLVLKGDDPAIDSVAILGDLKVVVEFTHLAILRLPTWGYYRHDALVAANGDCERVAIEERSNPNPQHPAYFVTEVAMAEKPPFRNVPMASLVSLRIMSKDGKTIGGYRVEP